MGLIERRIWKISRAGSLDRLEAATDRLSAPGPGEATVRVRAVGLNFADVFACLGLYSATPSGEFIPGLEFSGVVEAVGPVGDAAPAAWGPPRPGDRVMGVTRFGGYATFVNAEIARLRPIPGDWSFVEGAAFGVQALTAWYALSELGNLKKGQAVLVHSAAGGVGLNALSILERLEAVAIAVVGRDFKKSFLTDRRRLREEQILVRDRGRFGDQLDAAMAALDLDGLDLVLDSMAGPFLKPGYERLKAGGRLITFGAADMTPAGRRPNYLKLGWRYLRRPRLDPLQMIADNKSVMGFNLIWLWDRVDYLAALLDELAPLLPEAPFVGRSFPFEEAPAALKHLQSGRSVGKVTLAVE